MKKLKIFLILFLSVPNLFAQADLGINSLMDPSTIAINSSGILKVDVDNGGDVDVTAGCAVVTISVPAGISEITGVDVAGTDIIWTTTATTFPRTSISFRSTGGVILSDLTNYPIWLNVRGIALGGPSQINTNIRLALPFEQGGCAALGNQSTLNDNGPTSITVTTILAIKLDNFEASIKDCNAVLNWKTSSEENFSRYEIEFSENGRAFSKVGTVNGKNELNTVFNYQFIYNQLNSKGYYRLKMIDKDGKINYSKTILLLNKCADRLVSIYPSPINSNQIASVIVKNLKGKIIGELYGLDGKIVDGFIFNNGTNKMGVSKLAAGAYYLKVKDAEGFTQSLRVIVVRGQ